LIDCRPLLYGLPKAPFHNPPPSAAKYANTLYNTEKRRKREKEGKKTRVGRMRMLEKSLEALATLAGGASATHFGGRKMNSFALRKSINTRERKRERERKGGSRERLSLRERDEDDWQWPVVMVSRQGWDLKW
jgi:hypothetical protein